MSFDGGAVSMRVRDLRYALAEANGVPDEVWCFPKSEWNRGDAPLAYVEVSAWDLSEDGEAWTMFCTNGMSDAPPELKGKQPPTELMISLPVRATPEATHRVALWLAVATFSPFDSGRAYQPFDLMSLASGITEIPELAAFDALAFVDESVSRIAPIAADGVTVRILVLTPVDKALADLRRTQGVAAFKAALG